MKKLNIGTGILVGISLTAGLSGILYLGHYLVGFPFVPYEIFNWIARVLPGSLVTFGIDLMIDTLRLLGISVVDTAKAAERTMAILIFLGGGTFAGLVYFVVAKIRKLTGDTLSGLIMGALYGLPLIAITMVITSSTVAPLLNVLWMGITFLAWGAVLSFAYRRLVAIEMAAEPGAPDEAEPGVETTSLSKIGRRQFLIQLGAASAVVTVVGAGLGAVLAASERRRLAEALDESTAHQPVGSGRSPFPNANDPVMPVPGTRPEYTPVKDHYKVFLKAEPTLIDEASWILPITGMVDNPLMLTLNDIRENYEPHDQYVTLSCISGRVGTSLISTTQWTGARVQDVLADAGIQDGARYLWIESGDGFYETVDLDLIAEDERIMFCYSWDGNVLPKDHGFPLRIWIPDRYGMKQPKWITSIEVTDEYRDGYWVARTWDKVAQMKATSVIDTVAVDAIIEDGEQRYVPVGGIAHAGARGISKVEVRVDGGAWEQAQLRSPLSETTWVIWRYEWPFSSGEHTFEVRCAEGDGTPQIEEATGARPDGATGIHSVTARL